MERLTKRDIDGCLIHPWSFNGINGSYDIWDEDLLEKQIDRLAAYEDTGLEPEDVRRLQQDWTSLIMTLDEMGGMPHLHELVQAEKGGQLVVLPSKTVWELTMDAGPDCDMKCPVDAFDEALGCDLCSKAKQFAYERPCTQELLKELGKTVFLTRQEAEEAMAQEGGNDHA